MSNVFLVKPWTLHFVMYSYFKKLYTSLVCPQYFLIFLITNCVSITNSSACSWPTIPSLEVVNFWLASTVCDFIISLITTSRLLLLLYFLSLPLCILLQAPPLLMPVLFSVLRQFVSALLCSTHLIPGPSRPSVAYATLYSFASSLCRPSTTSKNSKTLSLPFWLAFIFTNHIADK